MPKCKSCKAEIVWVKMRQSGKSMPCDPQKITIVNVMAKSNGDHGDDELIGLGLVSGFVSHFATCPHAEQHRKPRADQTGLEEQPERPDIPTKGAPDGQGAPADRALEGRTDDPDFEGYAKRLEEAIDNSGVHEQLCPECDEHTLHELVESHSGRAGLMDVDVAIYRCRSCKQQWLD
jgi:hypothetical protein